MENPLTGGGTNRQDAMTCISMVYDVNGRKKPNKVGTDIILLNADLKTCLTVGSICIDSNDTPYGPVDCSYANHSSKDYKDYCGDYPSSYAADMWAGAKKACADKNMHLATESDLAQIAKEIYHLSSLPGAGTVYGTSDDSIVTKLNIKTDGSIYWSSREHGRDNLYYAYYRDFGQSSTGYYSKYKNYSWLARCVR